jgi:hypothetical protein
MQKVQEKYYLEMNKIVSEIKLLIQNFEMYLNEYFDLMKSWRKREKINDGIRKMISLHLMKRE